MMFRSKFAAFFATIVFSITAYATPFNLPPVCPSLSSIQAEGLTDPMEVWDGMFITYHFSNYDTDDLWAFFMGPVAVDTENEALDLTNEALAQMSGEGIPERDKDGEWFCLYEPAGDVMAAMAIRADNPVSTSKMRQIIQSKHLK